MFSITRNEFCNNLLSESIALKTMLMSKAAGAYFNKLLIASFIRA
jgi:hypothetical protein